MYYPAQLFSLPFFLMKSMNLRITCYLNCVENILEMIIVKLKYSSNLIKVDEIYIYKVSFILL